MPVSGVATEGPAAPDASPPRSPRPAVGQQFLSWTHPHKGRQLTHSYSFLEGLEVSLRHVASDQQLGGVFSCFSLYRSINQ